MQYDTINGIEYELTCNTTKSGVIKGYTLLIDSVEYSVKPLRGQALNQKTVISEVQRLLGLAKGKKASNWLGQQVLASQLWQASKPERKERSSSELMRSYERTNELTARASRAMPNKSGKSGTRPNRGLEIYLMNKI